MAKITDTMVNLTKDLVEKKGVTDSSASLYMRNLYTLNDKQPFKTLSFLRNREEIMKKIGEYAESTQKTFLASIVSVLSLMSEKPTYKSVHKFYYDEMMKRNADKTNTAEKTEKQKENWVSWNEVMELVKGLREKAVVSKKTLTKDEFDALLNFVVIALYTYIQPRRNQDYLEMMVVKKWKEDMPTDKNYLDIAGQRFVFNKYKTSKKYGTQMLEIPDTPEAPLFSTLLTYLKHHPLYKEAKGKTPVPFLVNADGSRLSAVNSITRILNRVFGKKVGSSMLRHIFLSDKYDISEMKKDADAMGHSINQQKEYMKVQSVDIPTTESV